MEDKKEILEELESIGALLLARAGTHPFRVPGNYFDALPVSITTYVKAETCVSSSIPDPYKVPAGYFETLADAVHFHIEAAETPLLHSINSKTAYSIPDGYFDRKIGIPVVEKAPAKVFRLKVYSRAVQYIAAAMLAGVLVTGAFTFTDKKDYLKPEKAIPVTTEPATTGDTSSTNEIAVTPAETDVHEKPVIINTVKRIPTFDKRIELLSDEELKNYLEENVSPEPIQIIEEDAEI